MGSAIVRGLANGGIFGLLAVGIVLVYKGTKVLNFAQGELGTLGLYIAWLFIEKLHSPWVVGATAAVIVVGGVGFAFDKLVVRRMQGGTRLSIAVATIGLLFLLISSELKIWGLSPRVVDSPIGGHGPKLFGFYVSPAYLLSIGAALAIGLAMAWFLRNTDFGLGVLAASQDPSAVRLVGVPLAKVSTFTWTSAAIVSVIAALLIEPNVGSFIPGFMTLLFVRGLAGALLGGLNSLPGAFVGGLAVGVIEEGVKEIFTKASFPGISLVAIFVVIIGVLILRPDGVLGRKPA